jgi:hypothetical protein
LFIVRAYVVFENVNVFGGLVDDVVPHLIGEHHVPLDQRILLGRVRAGGNHMTHSFVECVNLKKVFVEK